MAASFSSLLNPGGSAKEMVTPWGPCSLRREHGGMIHGGLWLLCWDAQGCCQSHLTAPSAGSILPAHCSTSPKGPSGQHLKSWDLGEFGGWRQGGVVDRVAAVERAPPGPATSMFGFLRAFGWVQWQAFCTFFFLNPVDLKVPCDPHFTAKEELEFWKAREQWIQNSP